MIDIFKHRLRNQFSNHYPPTQILEAAFDKAPADDDWSWYMAEALSNSIWFSSELVVGLGAMRESGFDNPQVGLEHILSEAISVADLMGDFLIGLLQAMLEIHFMDIKPAEHVLRVHHAPQITGYTIPFFMERPNSTD